MPTTEERLQHLEDDLAIRTLAARFADTSTRNDLAEFRTLWTPDAAWIISRPYAANCQGIDEIMTLMESLENGKEFFVHFVHSGVINVDGDRATVRWIIHEVAKGAGGLYYTLYGLFDDQMVRGEGGWQFSRREWTCLYMDTNPFPGTGYVTPERAVSSVAHG